MAGDVEVVEALDFDLACDWVKQPACEVPAAWAIVLLCCSATALLCEGHALRLRERIQRGLLLPFPLVCGYCKVQLHARRVEEIVRFERLGGGRG